MPTAKRERRNGKTEAYAGSHSKPSRAPNKAIRIEENFHRLERISDLHISALFCIVHNVP